MDYMILIENLYTMKVLYMRFIKALMEMDFSQQVRTKKYSILTLLEILQLNLKDMKELLIL